jgi:hemerythrin superfamily protein
MDAIQYLTDQHYEIESLFDQFESAARTTTKLRLRRKLLDLLAVHTAIEEMIFYPAARDAGGEELLLRALVEHLSAERITAELVEVDEVNGEATPKMAVLKERKKQHAAAEERELFPRVKELLTPDELERLGDRMAELADRLMGPGVGARERLQPRRALA